VAEDILKQPGEGRGANDSKEVYIRDIEDNIIKKLDIYAQRDKFTAEIINNFIVGLDKIKERIEDSKKSRSGIDKKPLNFLIDGIRRAQPLLGQAKKLREISEGMTVQCHNYVINAIRQLENSIEKSRNYGK
jgi:hypothetical protein